MARHCTINGKRNLIAERLIALRQAAGWSQRELADRLQLAGMDMDRNVITRIETNKRYVTDIELRAIASVFQITCDELIGPYEHAGQPCAPAAE
ncbi:MAG: helix-turn-helix domain-containing protein [Hominenteromicrobium sp.]